MSNRESRYEQEVWHAIPNWDGMYEVSNTGRIRSLSRLDSIGRGIPERILACHVKKSGHLQTEFTHNGIGQTVLVHRVVLTAFVGPCPVGMEGCHNNGKPWDNCLTNLRWDTRSANCLDSVRHGTNPRASRTHCKRSHVYDKSNTHWEGTKRRCRACASLGKRTRYSIRKGGTK